MRPFLPIFAFISQFVWLGLAGISAAGAAFMGALAYGPLAGTFVSGIPLIETSLYRMLYFCVLFGQIERTFFQWFMLLTPLILLSVSAGAMLIGWQTNRLWLRRPLPGSLPVIFSYDLLLGVFSALYIFLLQPAIRRWAQQTAEIATTSDFCPLPLRVMMTTVQDLSLSVVPILLIVIVLVAPMLLLLWRYTPQVSGAVTQPDLCAACGMRSPSRDTSCVLCHQHVQLQVNSAQGVYSADDVADLRVTIRPTTLNLPRPQVRILGLHSALQVDVTRLQDWRYQEDEQVLSLNRTISAGTATQLTLPIRISPKAARTERAYELRACIRPANSLIWSPASEPMSVQVRPRGRGRRLLSRLRTR